MIVEGHFQKLRMLKKLGTVYIVSEGFFQFWQNLISAPSTATSNPATVHQGGQKLPPLLPCFVR